MELDNDYVQYQNQIWKNHLKDNTDDHMKTTELK